MISLKTLGAIPSGNVSLVYQKHRPDTTIVLYEKFVRFAPYNLLQVVTFCDHLTFL